MAKNVTKKKNKKLRRQIRKTIGALLMVTAITVAAVPVQDVSAYPFVSGDTTNKPETIKVAVTSDHGVIGKNGITAVEHPYASSVPYAQDIDGSDNLVYSSGDGMFQFAFTLIDGANRGAVILNFNNVESSDTVTIPKTIEAYRKYSPNSTYGNYCLVSLNDELLGYRNYEQKTDALGRGLYRVNSSPLEIGNEMASISLKVDGLSSLQDLEVAESYCRQENGKWYGYFTYEYEGLNEDGNAAILTAYVRCEMTEAVDWVYRPCYYNTRSVWGSLAENNELYYLPKTDKGADDYGNWVAATTYEHWKIDAKVAYIGAEYVEETDQGWRATGYRATPEEGVFAERRDVTHLVIDAQLQGVADYAFYNCWTLESVEFTSGLDTIGNGAFAACGQLKSVTLPRNANVAAIGKDAFYNCVSLQSFTVPDGLNAIGDCAFEGCESLETINLLGSGAAVNLQYLGNHLFRGCSALSGIEFPTGYSEVLDIDMFEGCTSLQYIKLPNTPTGATINFGCFHSEGKNPQGVEGSYPNCTENTWEKFKTTVPDSFYFEGPEDSLIHTTANDEAITYKYPNQQLYERVEYEHDKFVDGDAKPDGKSAKVIYQVNDTGSLVKFAILKGNPDIITIPETIGAYGINAINQGSFSDLCDLTKVTIPASVTSIGANAFKGCHDLRTVIFTDATTIESIGADAFRTQVTNCEHTSTLYPNGGEKPSLYFVGAMVDENNNDTVPFQYAMNGSSKINHDNSENIWITCHSGWPTNLQVRYDDSTGTGEAQLVGYPRFDTILSQGVAQWVKDLPYVTAANEAEYKEMVEHVVKYVTGASDAPSILTPNEQEFMAAALNIVIPESVDSIEEGLFSGYDAKGNPVKDNGQEIGPDTRIRSILINGVDTIDPYTFKGCTGLTSADIMGSKMVGDYAFEDCESLTNVTIGPNLQDTGKRPFKGCEELTNVDCSYSSVFSYDSGIIYRQTGDGFEIVECLENRGAGNGSYDVKAEELEGVTSIKEEAFAECKEIASIDLSLTKVSTIPAGCFKDTELNTVTLPSSLKRIEEGAFQNRGAKRLVVYYKGDPMYIADDAFSNLDADGDLLDKNNSAQQTVIFQCLAGSNAEIWARTYPYITATDDDVYQEFEVTFWNLPEWPAWTNPVKLGSTQIIRAGESAAAPATDDLTCNDVSLAFAGWNVDSYLNVQSDLDVYATYSAPLFTVRFVDDFSGTEIIISEQQVSYGGAATVPSEDLLPTYEGYMFVGWNKEYYSITEDTVIRAIYRDSTGDSSRFKVTFYDYDGTELYYQYVNPGEDAIEPKSPTRNGYTFAGWMPSSMKNILKDTDYYATYTPGSTNGNGSGSGDGSGSGNGNGNGSNSSASPSASPEASPEVTKYTVSVSGGSGSGSYAAGEIVAINAYYLGDGQNFDKWTTSTAGVGFANPTATSTTFTMPAANVAITATYKTGNGTSTANNGGGGSGGSSGSGSTGNTNSGGTTVEVTKPGISNTGLAGATVSGSTDNFVVKVTESQTATDAAVAALQARYGDLSRIKYFPMDISLYDSTGRTKIADTSGISVSITLPLPDDLVQYAGNNRIAAIANDSLEDLTARFNTVDGVPCITFTATHFSPYVIYVDTANLTAGTIDSTPKTGDPIHPKWFLAIGLACVSLILFFKKDKTAVAAKVA